VMCEAVDNFGMKYAIWVKYPPFKKALLLHGTIVLVIPSIHHLATGKAAALGY